MSKRDEEERIEIAVSGEYVAKIIRLEAEVGRLRAIEKAAEQMKRTLSIVYHGADKVPDGYFIDDATMRTVVAALKGAE
jgi:hypothetical protein